jgi:DNA-binding CsgD family transcriptional regulator
LYIQLPCRVEAQIQSADVRDGQGSRRTFAMSAPPTERNGHERAELQIAQLAGERLSNRNIGQKLFVSPRTVSTHLYPIYPRLGVSGRGQLASVLSETA